MTYEQESSTFGVLIYELERHPVTRQWHAMCTLTKRTIEQGTDRAAVINAVEKLGYVMEAA